VIGPVLTKALEGMAAPTWGTDNAPVLASYPFRCRTPTKRILATLLPYPSTATWYGKLGVQLAIQKQLAPQQWQLFRQQRGDTFLEPFGQLWGPSPLEELLRRLLYTPAELVNPPSDGESNAKTLPKSAKLCGRLLLCVPGHFRELARRTRSATEAHLIESLGWILMEWLRDEIAKLGVRWWTPPRPPWANSFGATIPGNTNELLNAISVSQSIVTSRQDYQTAFQRWRYGAAGFQWQLEVGLAESDYGIGAGAPFYRDVVESATGTGIPTRVSIQSVVNRLKMAWISVVSAARGRPDELKFLTSCDDTKNRAWQQNAVNIRDLSLQGLEFVVYFPTRSDRPSQTRRTKLAFLQDLHPVFSPLFKTIYELGWNDLVFQTQGAACFRGKKIGVSLNAARQISDHSFGSAIDLNVIDNPQSQTVSRFDPRVVALFEAFDFEWGACFPTPDPHHFQYRVL
jgi:hypothetical protein